jgi:hypothetical protein
MKPLAPDEKIATVMVYTQNMLARGDVVTKESIRVSIWLRTQGVPNYVHVHKAQVIMFGGVPPKSLALEQIFIPTPQVIGFHLAPPAQDPMDYDTTESNRMMQPIELLLGSFIMKAKIRISTQTDLTTSLDVMRVAWVSVYDADISNPYLPQFSMHVPMMLVNPNQAGFGLME